MKYLILTLILFFAHNSIGKDLKTGMLFGDDHSFYITAPSLWILDNKSGVNQGIYMAYYPKGYTWSNSPVIAYGRSYTKDFKIQKVRDVVQNTVNEFKSNGSPNYEAKFKKTIIANNGTEIQVYHFSGDQWGNYEAVGYIEEKRTINFLVFNARKKRDFDNFLTDFYRMLKSYKNIYVEGERKYNEDFFNTLLKKSDQDVSTEDGKEYESKLTIHLGQTMANYITDCASYSKDGKIPNFNAIFIINKDGDVEDSYVWPVNSISLCFKGALSSVKMLPHKNEKFHFLINMTIN